MHLDMLQRLGGRVPHARAVVVEEVLQRLHAFRGRRSRQDFYDGPPHLCVLFLQQCRQPGVGKALLLQLATYFRDQGRAFMDLSVMHDNREAIGLYEELGFRQVPVYCVKTRNAINEHLYTGPRADESLNPYAQIITEEAYRRGIAVEVIDSASARRSARASSRGARGPRARARRSRGRP